MFRTIAKTACAVVIAGAVASPVSASAAKPLPSLTGAGRVFYSYSPEDDIRFSFQVSGNTINATGGFSFSHYVHSEGKTYRSRAAVDCLITGGHVATVTGKVVASDTPEFIGHRVGITVEDLGHHDRLGFSWAVSPGDPGQCLGTAPFATVIGGDYTVVDGPLVAPQ